MAGAPLAKISEYITLSSGQELSKFPHLDRAYVEPAKLQPFQTDKNREPDLVCTEVKDLRRPLGMYVSWEAIL